MKFALLALFVVMLLISGCRQKQEHNVKHTTDWNSIFSSNRPIVLTGTWQYAESGWMDLKVKRELMSNDDRVRWIQFQVEILQKTQNDPLKEEVRIMAIQELGDYPDISRVYLPWLKDGLATNFFKEPKVEQKARDVLRKLEDGKR